ncbi:MAG: hypothetical protein JNM17_03545 [Archangium sp.]|nr:hypothetical protein [Archangium sp.]
MLKHVAVAALTLTMLSCGRGDDADSAEDADESAVVTSSESALTTELSDEVAQPMSASPSDLATAASMRVASHVQPAGCLTVTVNGATVTYVFNDCTGPYGMVHVTGTVTAVYSRGTNGAVQAVISGTGVKVNNAVVDLNSTVNATLVNGVRTANVVSNATGTGPRGGKIDREGAYTITYDSTTECVTVDGTWTTKAALRTSTTVVAGYKRCKGTCPAAGGSIVNTTGRTVVTLAYDGSAVASWSTAAGRSGTVNLRCGGN